MLKHLTRVTIRGSAVVLGLVAISACSGSRDDEADSNAEAAATTPPADSAVAGQEIPAMPEMAGMTGNPDQNFLRMMSDHHTGMVYMAHATLERNDQITVKPDAEKMDADQDAELKRMMSILKQDFKDDYRPRVSDEARSMFEGVRSLSGTEYDRAFRESTIAHHRRGIQMIDEFMPKLQNAKVKAIAGQMRAKQTSQIAEQERKLRGD